LKLLALILLLRYDIDPTYKHKLDGALETTDNE